MNLKRKATQFAVVNLIHCRRVRRRDLSAKGRLPCGRLPNVYLLLTKILLNNYIFFSYINLCIFFLDILFRPQNFKTISKIV
ncbi:MAG: hypothetical protein LBK82_04045 [Planctomycetaceae bacterium]|nr:hypothetical protein [Planctomycetaceae bacterium]